MPSSEYSPNTGVDPLAPLSELLHELLSGVLHLGLGLLLGLLLAQYMRSRQLSWGWSACGLVVVLMMRSLLGGVFLILGPATLLACALGRRWQREDLEVGADIGRRAATMGTPAEALRRLLNRLSARRQDSRADDWFAADELTIGHERDGRQVSIPLGGPTGGTHTLVVGAAGSGKTVTETWIAKRAIERGFATIVLDPKDDPDMRGSVRRVAEEQGSPFVEWTPEGPAIYNPYSRGSETEIADKVLAAERFTEPHYLRQAQRYLGQEVRALRAAGEQVSLAAIVHNLDPAQLELLARGLPEPQAQSTHAYLDSLSPKALRDLGGVRDRLAIMAESDIGRWLDPSCGSVEQIDLLDALRQGGVVLFNLQADRRPLLAAMLGAAIVQDLQTAVAALQGRPVPSLVVIDEFSALASDQVVRLFGRARSAGMSLVLGTQELSDLRLPGREHLLEQVLGNLSALIAHRQVVPESAELIANIAGTAGAWRTSKHSGGTSTRTRVREYLIHPNEINRLGQGWAAVIGLAGGVVSIARILR